LLLDDLFDKLDEKRSSNILRLITENGFGQVFITDTNESRIRKFISKTPKAYSHYLVDGGKATSAP